ncbi:MAG TPA: thermonuclease family protein [Actinomycetota bacterium]|nr:thermonuclease family protein [Actinomycetota bacterium]
MTRTTHRIIAVVAALALALGGCSESTGPRGQRGGTLVTRVVDGDTAHVELDGRDVTIRFIGIDTPESVAPGQPVECFGPEAADYTTDRLEGARVRVEFDVEREDRFGRTLAYVWIGDELFNETLLRHGYALVTTFPPNVRYVDRFVTAQRDARERGRGLWRACA